MKTYTPQQPVPAAAITLATGNDPSKGQPILFTTQFGDSEGELIWVIKHLEISLVRDWTTSTADITLSCNIPDARSIPTLPDVSATRGGKYKQLSCEDEIRIYLGWIKQGMAIDASLLDSVPFNYDSADGNKSIKANPNKTLAPVFWGFIEKVSLIGDERGAQIRISCRDRTRVMTDTKILSVPSLSGNKGANGKAAGARENILIEVARAATGNIIGEDNANPDYWRRIIGDAREGALVYTGRPDAEGSDSSVELQPLGDEPDNWVRRATFTPPDATGNPRFHRWVQRPPIVKNSKAAVYQVFNRSPIDVINYLASTEEKSTDFYASHVNGDFVFAPRIIDTSGLEDPDRNYRTYFYRSYPKGCSAPTPAQIIKRINVLNSSLGTFNRFIVINAGTNNAGQTTLDNVTWAINGQPDMYRDRAPQPPVRAQLIFDDTLGNYVSIQGGASIVAMSAARTLAKDTNATRFTIMGDATLYPGEAVKVYNTILHDDGISVPVDTTSEVKAAEEEINKQLAEALKIKDVELPVADIVGGNKVDPGAQAIQDKVAKAGRLDTNQSEFTLPTYKVRSIRHRLTTSGEDMGFTTEVAAVADY